MNSGFPINKLKLDSAPQNKTALKKISKFLKVKRVNFSLKLWCAFALHLQWVGLHFDKMALHFQKQVFLLVFER